MYYDLNIAWPVRIPLANQAGGSGGNAGGGNSKKQKGKQAANSDGAANAAAAVKVGAELLSAGEKADVEKAVKMAIKRG